MSVPGRESARAETLRWACVRQVHGAARRTVGLEGRGVRVGEGGVSGTQGTRPRSTRQAVVETLAAVPAKRGRDLVPLVF